MKIKGVTKKGDVIPHKPVELVKTAVLYSLKMQNSKDKLYWFMEETMKVASFSSFEQPKAIAYNRRKRNEPPKFHAKASGTVDVGFTQNATGHFHKAFPYSFAVEYESAKDDLGLPDIKVISCKLTPIQKNPSKRVKFEDLSASTTQLAAHAKQFKKEQEDKKVAEAKKAAEVKKAAAPAPAPAVKTEPKPETKAAPKKEGV